MKYSLMYLIKLLWKEFLLVWRGKLVYIRQLECVVVETHDCCFRRTRLSPVWFNDYFIMCCYKHVFLLIHYFSILYMFNMFFFWTQHCVLWLFQILQMGWVGLCTVSRSAECQYYTLAYGMELWWMHGSKPTGEKKRKKISKLRKVMGRKENENLWSYEAKL